MKYNFRYALLLFCIVYTYNLWASFETRESGARELALANAVVAMTNTPFAIYYNPANISVNGNFNIFSSYRNFFGLPEISQADLVFNTFLNPVNSAFCVSKFGNDLYSEIQISAGGSYKILNNLAVGLSLQGYFLTIEGYGSARSLGLNLGFQYQYLDQLSIGAHITNINNPKIGKIKEEIPQTFSLGFKYHALERADLYFEFYRDVHYEQDYRAGLEYELLNSLFLRGGIMDNSNTYSFGFGTYYRFIHIDYALINHADLGVSHAISLGVDI